MLNLVGVGVSAVAVVCGVWLSRSNGDLDGASPTVNAISSTHEAEPHRVRIEAGTLRLSADDWESESKVARTEATLPAFYLDRFEVTYAQWATCTSCAPLPVGTVDPRTPVVHVTPLQADAFCRQRQGRLPTRLEWVYAASTQASHRYPWGQTGLVCRKVVFGMVNGPCAFGQGAEPVGSRPLGATELGIHDLSGNVAEWAYEGEEAVALGGSFRSTLAGQLKVWAHEQTAIARDDIGFRCAYDAPQ